MTEPSENTGNPGGPRQVDAVVALAETFAVILSSMLELMPPLPIQQGDVSAMARMDQNQKMLALGMHQLHGLLAAMGSPMVTGPPEEAAPVPTPSSSGIILPGRG